MTRLLLMVCIFLLSGCVNIKAPQLESLLAQVHEPKDPLAPFMWNLTMGKNTVEVLNVNVEGGQVFANKQNDAIFYDGAAIKRIIKIGSMQNRIEVEDMPSDEGITRTIKVNGNIYEKFNCSEWHLNGAIMQQDCKGARAHRNEIHSKNNKMVLLKQWVPYVNEWLILSQ